MRRWTKACVVLVCVLTLGLAAGAGIQAADYKPASEHQGGDVTPAQALEMLKKDPAHTVLVDVRTAPEYEFIGHPPMAYNIPLKVWTGKFVAEKKEYAKDTNPNFGKDLLARFDPKADTLILMCRSGHRSASGATEAVKAGFDPAKVFNMMGGFEGNLVNDKRLTDGWRNEGLPSTYTMDPTLVYAADVLASGGPGAASAGK